DLVQHPVVHLPVYDCSSDLFEKPCAHDEYRQGIGRAAESLVAESLNSVGIGFARARDVQRFVPPADDDESALVNCGDHLYVLEIAGKKREPGATCRMIVRSATDKYYTWWWKTGFRPSAYAVDPPFYVKDIWKNPELWLKRVEELRQLGR